MASSGLKRAALLILTSGIASGFYSSAQAIRSFRVGAGLNNQNAADMSTIKHYEFITEGILVNTQLNQSDFTINGIPGSARSSHTNLIPYFRLAYRLNPKWVVGFDYNHPLWTQIGYPAGSFVSGLSVDTIIHSYNLNPRVSYQVSPNVAIGAGADILNFSGALTSQIPAGGPLLTTIRIDGTWLYGWDAGIFLTLRKGTYASLAMFSSFTATSYGSSSFGSIRTLANFTDTAPPKAVILRLTQMLSPKWMVRLTGVWDEQGVAQRFVFNNTALGQVTVPLYNHDSYLFSLLTTYQINKRWGFLLGASYEDGSQPTFTNTVPFPIGDVWTAFAGPSINLSKIASFQVYYAHVWAPSYFNYVTSSRNRVVGTNHTNVNILDFRLTFKA